MGYNEFMLSFCKPRVPAPPAQPLRAPEKTNTKGLHFSLRAVVPASAANLEVPFN